MKISLSDLRDLAKSDFEGQKHPRRADCPAPEKLVLCARSVLPKREKALIIDHIATCHDCTEEITSLLAIFNEEDKLIRNLEEAKAVQKNAKLRTFGLSPRRPIWNIASASLLVFLAALTVYSIARFLAKAPQQRGMALSIELVSPVDKAYAGGELKFIWKGRPDVKYYYLEAFDASMKLLWRSGDVSGNELLAPEELVRILIPQKAYFWMVTAVLEDDILVRSKLTEFETTGGVSKIPRSK